MCQTCENIQVNSTLQVNAKSYDPTRTTVLRNAFVKDLNKRWAILIRLINQSIIDEDCFGLEKTKLVVFIETTGHKAFQFVTSQEKADAFMKWLNGQVDKNMLEVTNIQQIGQASNQAWTNKYISDSYKRGVIRARYELQKAGFNSIPSIDTTGGINLSMTTPFHIDRLGTLYSRTYTDLKGITSAMDTQISRVLAQGIADGDNPRLLAKKIVNEIDGSGTGDLATKGMSAKRRSEILARTEIIRAHHQATIQEYRNWAAEDVIVQAEFTTAGDGRVCPECASLHGKIYTLDAIQNLIPVHPQCRCIALPTLPDENLEEIPTEVPKVDAESYNPIANAKDSKKWLKENGVVVNKEYDNLSIDQMNSINKAFHDTKGLLNYDLGNNIFEKIEILTDKDDWQEYLRFSNRTLFLNRDANFSDVYFVARKDLLANNLNEAITHELGHGIDRGIYTNKLSEKYGYTGDLRVEISHLHDKRVKDKAPFISTYASQQYSEDFAECWLGFTKGETKLIPKKLLQVFKNITTKE